MSVQLMTLVFNYNMPDLKTDDGRTVPDSTAKFILLALADHANDEGEGAYPSIDKLCKKTSMSRATVCNAVNALRFNGFTDYEGISKYGTKNYTISAAKLSEVQPLNSAKFSHRTPTSSATKPESSIKPSIQPSVKPNTGADAPKPPINPASLSLEWQIGAGVETVVIPEESDVFREKAKSWSSLIAMNNADLEPLAFEFMTSANRLPTDADVKFWRKVLRKYRKFEPKPATETDIHQAVIQHIAARLPIKGPQSIEWALLEIMNPLPQVDIFAEYRKDLQREQS